MARKTRNDKGAERPLTTQEKAIRRAKKNFFLAMISLNRGAQMLARVEEDINIADYISPSTDNRRRVRKSARKSGSKR